MPVLSVFTLELTLPARQASDGSGTPTFQAQLDSRLK